MFYGYYADSVLKDNDERFKQMLTFLFEALGLRNEHKALAIQACDTLCTVVCDQDLVPRIEGIIDSLLPIVNEFTKNVELELFFDFLSELTRIYKETIGINVVEMLHALVVRVQFEYKACLAEGKKNNMIINKCWNVIR